MTIPANTIIERGPALPDNAACYRQIGPFNEAGIPAGLFGLHRLKDGAWGLLEVVEGSIRFIWDGDDGGSRLLSAPAAILIPPQVPHHLERVGPVKVSIGFWAAA